MTGRIERTLRSGGLALALFALGACGGRQAAISQLAPEDLWNRGIAEYNEEDWDEAIRYFERFALAAGADPRVYQARYYVSQANFAEERYVTAAAEFTRLAADLGRQDLADDARFMACRSYEELSPGPQLDQEYTRAAIQHCATLADYFPESDHVAEANAIIDRMRNRLAQKVYGAGEWYYRRRAYDSALIYYEDVAEQYPGTRWAPRALRRMIEIYETLGYVEERDAAVERLRAEYPESSVERPVSAATDERRSGAARSGAPTG